MIIIFISDTDIIINEGILNLQVKLGIIRNFMHYWSWIWILGTVIVSSTILFWLYIVSFYCLLPFNKS